MARRQITIKPEDPPHLLLEMTHEQFYNFVDQDVRKRLDRGSPQGEGPLGSKLRDPMVAERWYVILIQMKKNVESQLASAKADWQTVLFEILSEIEDADTDSQVDGLRAEQFAKHAEYCEARAKKLRFRSAVEDSLSEARHLRNQMVEQRASTRLLMASARVQELTAAIEQHRSQVDAATDADKTLWSVLTNGAG